MRTKPLFCTFCGAETDHTTNNTETANMVFWYCNECGNLQIEED